MDNCSQTVKKIPKTTRIGTVRTQLGTMQLLSEIIVIPEQKCFIFPAEGLQLGY